MLLASGGSKTTIALAAIRRVGVAVVSKVLSTYIRKDILIYSGMNKEERKKERKGHYWEKEILFIDSR